MPISFAKQDDANQDLSGMEALHQDFQRLEHRISLLSRHRFVTYGVTTLSMVLGLVFFLLALRHPARVRHPLHLVRFGNCGHQSPFRPGTKHNLQTPLCTGHANK